MSESGLLAHLRDHFHVPPENLATETLAYILNTSESARKTFLLLARRAQPRLPELTRYVTQVTSVDDGGIPDLVGIIPGGEQPLLGEIKFDAGLTSHQPVSYLKRLESVVPPNLLLFIVPERRVEMVWDQIRWRCSSANTPLGQNVSDSLPMVWASMGNTSVGLTSWDIVLDTIKAGLDDSDDASAVWDLQQLSAMCGTLDREAFVPLSSVDLESRAGRRMVDFAILVRETANELLADKTMTDKGPERYIFGWGGVYFRIAGWECWLGLSWENWAGKRPTPVWLMITDSRARNNVELANALLPLLSEDPSRLLSDGWRHLIPIYLKEHVDRDRVIEGMAIQVREIDCLLKRCPPPEEGE